MPAGLNFAGSLGCGVAGVGCTARIHRIGISRRWSTGWPPAPGRAVLGEHGRRRPPYVAWMTATAGQAEQAAAAWPRPSRPSDRSASASFRRRSSKPTETPGNADCHQFPGREHSGHRRDGGRLPEFWAQDASVMYAYSADAAALTGFTGAVHPPPADDRSHRLGRTGRGGGAGQQASRRASRPAGGHGFSRDVVAAGRDGRPND